MARDDRSRGRRVREDHGPGCPADRFDRDAWSGIYQYGSDSFIAERVCDLIEEAVPCIVLPTMHYNICAMTKNYPGVISIPPDVMTQMYDAIFRECARNGFKKIFAAVCHGGSETPVQFLANMVHERATAEAPGKPAEPDYYLSNKTLSAAGAEEYAQDSLVEVGHGGEIETALNLASRPEFVHLDRLTEDGPTNLRAVSGNYHMELDQSGSTWIRWKSTPRSA